VATTIVNSGDSDDDENMGDFGGIEKGLMKPLATQWRAKSWVFQHGYYVVERKNPGKLWFVCNHCHNYKVVDAGGPGGPGMFDVSRATSAAAHLSLRRRGHMIGRDGTK
jgi:hypothetical protein